MYTSRFRMSNFPLHLTDFNAFQSLSRSNRYGVNELKLCNFFFFWISIISILLTKGIEVCEGAPGVSKIVKPCNQCQQVLFKLSSTVSYTSKQDTNFDRLTLQSIRNEATQRKDSHWESEVRAIQKISTWPIGSFSFISGNCFDLVVRSGFYTESNSIPETFTWQRI